MGSVAGLQGAFKLGQGGGVGHSIGAGALGAFSGLLGFGGLSALFPALVAAGPVGWIAAAGIGAAIGLSGLLFKSPETKIVEKVKSVYGVTLSKQFAKDALWPLIKQGYGGNIDAGIRSMQVRQLIELYAQTTGQNAKGIVDHAQPSVFSNQNGKFSELPTYFNGSPVMPGDTRSTVGIPQIGNNGQYFYTPSGADGANVIHTTLQLDAEATQSILQGQAVQVINNQPRLISSATTAGQSLSSTQRSVAAGLMNPTMLTS